VDSEESRVGDIPYTGGKKKVWGGKGKGFKTVEKKRRDGFSRLSFEEREGKNIGGKGGSAGLLY